MSKNTGILNMCNLKFWNPPHYTLYSPIAWMYYWDHWQQLLFFFKLSHSSVYFLWYFLKHQTSFKCMSTTPKKWLSSFQLNYISPLASLRLPLPSNNHHPWLSVIFSGFGKRQKIIKKRETHSTIYSYRYISIYIQTKTSTHRPPPPSPFASIFFL